MEKNSDGFVVDCQCDLSLGEGAVRIRRISRVQIITGTEQDGQAIDDDPLDECHVPRMFDNFETCLRVDNRDDVRATEMLIKSQIREIESWSLTPSDVGAWLVNARVWHEGRAVGRGGLTSRGKDVVEADTQRGVRGDEGVYPD